MQPIFPKNPYKGEVFYYPPTKKVYRYDEPVDKDGKKIQQLCHWEDITECFVNNPTGPFKNTQGEKS